MSTWNAEEVAAGIELWLITRRDGSRSAAWDAPPGAATAYETIDYLLDEARECFAEGWMPWQRIGSDG